MAITLIAPPGLSDLPDSALNAEEIAQGQHAVKILENTKFGVVRPEFFYMGRFSDGQTVARPVSKVDNLPYQASEVIYLWEIVLTADPRDGITSGPGTILYFDYDVEQRADNDPGLVHCKTVYHVQGGQTTETQDGELSVWAIGIRGLDQLDLAAVPAWTNVPDANFDLDSAWREDRLKNLNAAAKRSIVQAEFFDLGEFGNGQTVPQPVSDVDGFTYPYADLVFLTSWRWTPAFASGITSGPSGATIARLEKNVNGATGVVDTTVTYRLGASTDTVTQDGRVRVFAFGFRAGITATGTVSFTDLNANVFLPGKPPLDDDALVMVRNSKFAALRPEFFITTQAHGTTVPLPTSPIDSYAYARAELIYLYARSDTAAPGSIGSLLTLHGFIRQDTGAVTLNTLYFNQGGAQTNTNNGTFRVMTVALRSKDVEVDIDPNTAGGGEPGFEGDIDSEQVLRSADRLTQILQHLSDIGKLDFNQSHTGQGALSLKSAVDLATAEVTNKTAVNIAETGARKWLPDLNRIWTTQAQRDAAVDTDGNLLLKNVVSAVGTTSGPTKVLAGGFTVIPEMTKTFTAKGNPVIMFFDSMFSVSGGGAVTTLDLQFFKGGVALGRKIRRAIPTGTEVLIHIARIDPASPSASVTYDMRWDVVGGTGTVTAVGTDREIQVVELG